MVDKQREQVQILLELYSRLDKITQDRLIDGIIGLVFLQELAEHKAGEHCQHAAQV